MTTLYLGRQHISSTVYTYTGHSEVDCGTKPHHKYLALKPRLATNHSGYYFDHQREFQSVDSFTHWTQSHTNSLHGRKIEGNFQLCECVYHNFIARLYVVVTAEVSTL